MVEFASQPICRRTFIGDQHGQLDEMSAIALRPSSPHAVARSGAIVSNKMPNIRSAFMVTSAYSTRFESLPMFGAVCDEDETDVRENS